MYLESIGLYIHWCRLYIRNIGTAWIFIKFGSIAAMNNVGIHVFKFMKVPIIILNSVIKFYCNEIGNLHVNHFSSNIVSLLNVKHCTSFKMSSWEVIVSIRIRKRMNWESAMCQFIRRRLVSLWVGQSRATSCGRALSQQILSWQ